MASHLPARFQNIFGPPRGKATLPYAGRGFFGRFHVAGSSESWIVEVFRTTPGASGWQLEIQGLSNGTSSGQQDVWQFHLPLGDVAVGTKVEQVRIDTGTALGPFGKIDLRFHSARRLRLHAERCPTTHVLLDSSAIRQGTMHGSFNFTPNEGTIPNLEVKTFMVRAFQARFSGARCPNGSHHVQRCSPQTAFNINDPSQELFAGGSVRGPFPGANREYFVFAQDRVGPALELHSIGAESATPVVRRTPSGVLVDASGLGPLLTGSLRFEAGATTVRIGTGMKCTVARTHETWASGTLTVAFDSGTVTVTGAGLRASLIDYSR